MKYLIQSALTLVIGALLFAGCSSSSSNEPVDKTTVVRLINCVYDDTLGLDLYVGGKKIISRTRAGKSGGYAQAGINGEAVEVAVHYADSAGNRFKSAQRISEGGSYTAYAIPPAQTISVSWSADNRIPDPGTSRIKLVQAVPDGGSLALSYTDAASPLLGPIKYTEVTNNYAQINSGTYAFSVVRSNNTELFAFDSVSLLPNTCYTLVLYGTLSTSDSWGFAARLFNDMGTGTDYIDLVEAPNRGKMQMVHAVPGVPPITVNVDGSTLPLFSGLAFSSQTPYVDLATGAHTLTATANGTNLVTNVPFGVGKRTKTSLFLTGTSVPPNMALLELADLLKPHAESGGSVRIVNLCPDAGALDGYIITASGEEKILDAQSVPFRGTSFSSTFNSAFFNMFPTNYRFVFKKAGTSEVVVPSTSITIQAGKIVTLWIGGLSASAKLYTMQHD